MRQLIYRFLRLLTLAILTFVLVSACGRNAPQQATQGDDTSTVVTRVVEHAMGKAKVPFDPQRVVDLSDSLDTVLSLGVKPVGSAHDEQDYYLEDGAEGIELVGSSDNPNLESIVALKPDLILGTEYDSKKNYKLLSQIAPTVIAKVDGGDEWKTLLSKFAEALGKTDKAQQIMADYDARIKDFQTQMGDRLQQTEVSIIRVRQDRTQIYLEDSFCGSVVADAGLPRPPYQTNTENPFAIEISKEVLQKADGDVIFVWTFGHNEVVAQEVQTTLKQLKADPLWSKLSAVQQGKVYEVPSYWFGSGPISANLILDDLFKYLVE